MGNPLLETMGISYDGNMLSDSVTPETAYANTGLPYGPMPKETASGKVIPMPKRKVRERPVYKASQTCGYYSNSLT